MRYLLTESYFSDVLNNYTVILLPFRKITVMIKHPFNLVLGLLLFLNLHLFAQEAAPKKVLFVGNSYTYFWNLPQTVQAMAKEKKVDLTTRQSTSGGVHWGHHWRAERNLNTPSIIKEEDFDAIVLQNHSMSTFNRVDSMYHFGQRFSKLGKQKGAQIYLYLTWAREWNPLMQKTITEEYTKLATTLKAKIVPVGPAWALARQLRPNFQLYDDDGSHPSALGTYLSACVFYGVLTGQSPIGLPNRLTAVDKDGEKIYLTIQSKESATFCQEIAAEILKQKSFNQRINYYKAPADSWQTVYKSNKEGNGIVGSKKDLINAIRQGLPIKIAWGSKGKTHTIEHVAEPIWLAILDEQEVMAHLPSQVLSSIDWDALTANYANPSKLEEEWRVVITTKGAFDAVWYDRKKQEHIKRVPQQHPITWMVKGNIDKTGAIKPLFKE